MPTVQANGIEVYYEVTGEGEPMVLIPYLAADQACYAFQVAEYAKHYTCFTVDLRGAGLSGKPEGVYTTELFGDDIAAFMQGPGSAGRTCSGCRWARRPACGWPPGTRTGSGRCSCTAPGRPPTRSCARSCRAGRSSPRPWPASPR